MGVQSVVVEQEDRRTTAPPPRGYTPPQMLWPSTPKGVHRARRALGDTLTGWGMPELVDDAGLVLAELMTNAHKHGRVRDRSIGTSFLRADNTEGNGPGVVIEVHDSRGEQPALVKALDDDESGRGLTIVDALTDHRWGVIARPGPGKVVWAAIGVWQATPQVDGVPQ